MKMAMNKLALPVLGLIAALSVTGCSTAEVSEVVPVTPTSFIAASTAVDPYFQIGEKSFELGTASVQDIVDAGAVFASDNQVESIDFSEDAHFSREMKFKVGPTNLTVQAKNMTGEIAPVSASVIQGVYFDGQQACGTGGIMVGDSVEDVTKKLGEPYLVVNTEDYRYEQGQAAMESNSRVYGYVSRLDDMTVRICIDRNTSKVTLIEEVKPSNIIIEPRQVTDDQIKKLVKAFRKSYSTSTKNARLMDAKGKNEYALSGPLSSISYEKFRVLTLDKIKDSKKFYLQDHSYDGTATASSYLIVIYSAILTLDDGEGGKNRQDVYGGFYLPNARLTDEGTVTCSLQNADYKECEGVYSTESALIESIFAGSELGYGATSYTSMERAI